MSARIVEIEGEPPLVDMDQPDAPQTKQEDVKHTVESLAALIAENISEQGRATTGIVKENTVWDVYNNEARKVDIELVKDWRESLNFLLVFAAIFAAVLTPFIIESKKMLEPDQAGLLVNVTLWNINNNGNQSNLPYSPPSFESTSAGILINCLLFASLGASLVAALASVVALQWVANYDASITRGGSSPQDRAKRRQFRFSGVVDWKMSEIIAALPLLLYSSVILFWAGTIQWMWTLHHIVGYVVAGGTLIAVLFYASTTVVGAAFVSAPFRTPLSRGIYWVLHPLMSFLPRFQWFKAPFRIASRPFHRPTRIRPRFGRIYTWFKKNVIPNKTSREREDIAAKFDIGLEPQALIWLASQLPVTVDSRHRLGLLLNQLLATPMETSISPEPVDDPWLSILESFSGEYMRRILGPAIPEDKYEDIGALLHCIKRISTQNGLKFSPLYETDPQYSSYWTQCCFTVKELASSTLASSENMSLLLTRDVPLPSINSEVELKTSVKLIKWRNFVDGRGPNIWIDIFAQRNLYSVDYLESCLQSFKSFISSGGYSATKTLRLQDNEAEERGPKIVQIFEVADYLLQRDKDASFHQGLISFLCMNIKAYRGRWSLLRQPPEDVWQRIINTYDPCLALLAVRAWGLPVVSDIPISGVYAKAYKISISKVRDILYSNLSLSDSEALWRARAAAFRTHIYVGTWVLVVPPTYNYFEESIDLTYLQLVLEHPTNCKGHSQGAHHILYHLYHVGHHHVNVIGDLVLLGDVEIREAWANVVLGLLVCSDTEHFSPLFSFHGLNADCIERISDICKAAKQQPASILLLLRDLSARAAEYYSHPNEPVFILESVEQARALPEDEDSTLSLRPLAQAVDLLGQKMLEDKYWDDLGRKKKVVGHAKRIAGLLHARSASKVIISHSHIRMLSCARASTSTQPAIDWLPMYIER